MSGMRGAAPHRWGALLLVAVAVLLVGLGSDPEQALTQSLDDPGYALDSIIVKPKEGASTQTLARIASLNGPKGEEELALADLRLVTLPTGMSVPNAIGLYESLPGVEFAEPDYYMRPVQSDPGGDATTPETVAPEPYDPDPGDIVEPAPYEPPPQDPPPDAVSTGTGAQAPGITPFVPNDQVFGELYGMNNTGQAVNAGPPGTLDADIDMPEAWSVTTGSPEVVVAVIDSGVDINHPDLAGNIWTNPDEIPGNGEDDDNNGYIDDVNGWDFNHRDNTVFDSSGEDSHGTHVAGTIAAEGNNGLGVAGVSWRTRIMPLKFLAGNSGRASDAISAIGYAVAEGAKISNNSWECVKCITDSVFSESLRLAIEEANFADHLFVAAAGNSGQDNDSSPRYPSGYDLPNVISVAATDNKDGLWSDPAAGSSNYGATSVDLAAPGSQVLSTIPNRGYGFLSGTSMATPHVSGVAALLKSRFPGLTHLEIKDRIMGGTEAKAALAGKMVTGGRLNSARALGLNYSEAFLFSDKPSLTYGEGVTFTGILARYGEPLAGKQVAIEKRRAGETGYSTLATVTTAQDGSFSYGTSYPANNTYYRARLVDGTGSASETFVNLEKLVGVRVSVTLSVATTKLQLGKARAITGYVGPNHSGKQVRLTVRRGSTTVLDTNLTLDANSRYSLNYKPRKTGVYYVSVEYGNDEDNLGNKSPTKSFKVVN